MVVLCFVFINVGVVVHMALVFCLLGAVCCFRSGSAGGAMNVPPDGSGQFHVSAQKSLGHRVVMSSCSTSCVPGFNRARQFRRGLEGAG